MIEHVVQERDFYRSLVELSSLEDSEHLLGPALAVLVDLSRAREVYLELRGSRDHKAIRWWASAGCDATRIDAIREAISTGIIAEAIETGRTIETASAMDDRRFKDRASVRDNGIEAVLCAPIGRNRPLGVVYVQGQRGETEFMPFSSDVRKRVELFSLAIAPIAELLIHRAESEPTIPNDGPFSRVVSRSPLMHELVERLRLVATLDVHVLLTGPSGVGKTLLAEAIHAASARRSLPFVALNCAAIPESLLENELFGADPGAHSAVPKSGVVGKVEAAEGGTLFLDEIAELSLTSQAALLQLLQDRTYFRLGSTVLRTADVRLLAATNIDLPQAVASRRFREDLYYRLKVFEARIPGLEERKEDVLPLALHFTRAAAQRHRLDVKTLDPASAAAILAMDWPGNVRELAHRMESAVLHAHLRGREHVEVCDVFPDSPRSEHAPATSLEEATRRFQKKHVREVLESTDWNVSEAARQLEVARSYLYTLMRTLELRRGE